MPAAGNSATHAATDGLAAQLAKPWSKRTAWLEGAPHVNGGELHLAGGAARNRFVPGFYNETLTPALAATLPRPAWYVLDPGAGVFIE